jgi:hypothetical protein
MYYILAFILPFILLFPFLKSFINTRQYGRGVLGEWVGDEREG